MFEAIKLKSDYIKSQFQNSSELEYVMFFIQNIVYQIKQHNLN